MAQRSNYAGHHSDARPTLPPIRDLFRDEFSRLGRDENPQYSPSLPFSQLQVVDNPDRPDSSLGKHKSSLQKGQPVYGRFDPRYSEPYDHSQQSIPSGMASSSYAPPGRIEYSMSHPSLKPSDSRRVPSYMSHPGSQEYAPYVQSSGTTSVAYPQASMRSHTKDHTLVHQRSASVLTDARMSPSAWNVASGSAYRTDDDERTPVARFGDSPPYGLVNIPHADVYQQEESMQGVGSKYDCPYCGKGFNRPSSLKIHLNSHTGEKPFACPVENCGRSFSVLSNMRRHARVHTVPSEQEPPSSEAASSSTPGARVHMRRSSSTSSSNASTISRRSRSISSNDDHTEWENLDKRLRRNIA